MDSSGPRISIIVAVYNSQSTISKCLESIFGLDHPSYEVIVVDDGSSDRTAELCEAFSGAKVIRLDRGGPSRARNIGVLAARGAIVAFTDGDCIVDGQWLNELERGFIRSDVAGVGGDQRSPADESEMGKRIQEFLKISGIVTKYIKTDATFRETDHNPSCNSAYRKVVIEEIGGFDETQFPGEDLELDLKILRRGHRLIYNPAAVVEHYRPGTYLEFCRMMRRYGAGEWHLVRKHGFFRMSDLEPVAVAAGLISVIALLVIYPHAWPVILLPWPIIAFWFFLKTGNLAGTVQFVVLFMITLTNWNWGFFTGSRYRPGK
jgi:cellulose synthase/poly-beta-1,6-N-acetylglucosamine synthase-like glycosyltransferase